MQKILRPSDRQAADWTRAAKEAGLSFNQWACGALDDAAQQHRGVTPPAETERDDPGLIRKTHLEPVEAPRVQTHKFKPDFKKGAR